MSKSKVVHMTTVASVAPKVTTREDVDKIIAGVANDIVKGREAWPVTFVNFVDWSEADIVSLDDKSNGAPKGKGELIDDASNFVDRIAALVAEGSNHEKAFTEKYTKNKKSEIRTAIKLGKVVVDGKRIGLDVIGRAKDLHRKVNDPKTVLGVLNAYTAVARAQNELKTGKLDDTGITKAFTLKHKAKPAVVAPTVISIWQEAFTKAETLVKGEIEGLSDNDPDSVKIVNAMRRHIKRLELELARAAALATADANAKELAKLTPRQRKAA